MATTAYGFAEGLDYEAIVAKSEQVAWTVDEVFGDRRFDASKSIVPESWLRTKHLDFLDADQQRTLNHARAFSYAHLFGNYEEFIPLHLTAIAQRDWHGDRSHLRALVRFSDEEMKHQQLFLRTEAVLEVSCGHPMGRYFGPDKVRVTELTDAILAFPPLPRSLLLLALEWGSQRHYVDSVRDRASDRGDPLYVDVLKHHWIEESQHVKTGVLEVAELARALSPPELVEAFDDVGRIHALIDQTFVGQAEEEIDTAEHLMGRGFPEPQRALLREALYASMVAIWSDVALGHPRFVKLALELSPEGAARLGIAETL
jgi:hypothetical protein